MNLPFRGAAHQVGFFFTQCAEGIQKYLTNCLRRDYFHSIWEEPWDLWKKLDLKHWHAQVALARLIKKRVADMTDGLWYGSKEEYDAAHKATSLAEIQRSYGLSVSLEEVLPFINTRGCLYAMAL